MKHKILVLSICTCVANALCASTSRDSTVVVGVVGVSWLMTTTLTMTPSTMTKNTLLGVCCEWLWLLCVLALDVQYMVVYSIVVRFRANTYAHKMRDGNACTSVLMLCVCFLCSLIIYSKLKTISVCSAWGALACLPLLYVMSHFRLSCGVRSCHLLRLLEQNRAHNNQSTCEIVCIFSPVIVTQAPAHISIELIR